VSVLLVGAPTGEAEGLDDVLRRAPSPCFDVQIASLVPEAVALIERAAPDVVILDAAVSPSDYGDALRRIRAAAPDAAVIVRADSDDAGVAMEVLAEGAQDYLLTDAPMTVNRITRSILFALARAAADRASRQLAGEQRSLLAGVVEHAPIGMAMSDTDGHFMSVNRAMCELLGRDAAELEGRSFADFTHPDDVATDVVNARSLLRGQIETSRTEKRYIHADGHTIWVDLSVSLVRDNAGRPLHFVSQITDMTERKRVERDLQRERDHTAAIIAAMGEGYSLVVDDHLVEVNDALCTLTGYTRAELLGPVERWPVLATHLRRTQYVVPAGDGEGEAIVGAIQRKDGTSFTAELTSRPARHRDGSLLGWVTTIRDVSERTLYEAELERLATQDPLTGLANHRVFHQRLHDAVAHAVRHDRPLSVVVMDLDHFKRINDEHGHIMGDHALEAVAARLRTVVREGELLARVGGEEFAWILPEADSEGAVAAAERARTVVSAQSLLPVGVLTLSAGVGTRDTLTDAGALYERADQALYRAKADGRNRTVLWDPVVR
jgi:diguanylate cyclase